MEKILSCIVYFEISLWARTGYSISSLDLWSLKGSRSITTLNTANSKVGSVYQEDFPHFCSVLCTQDIGQKWLFSAFLE